MIKKLISALLSVSMMVSLVSVANAADTAGNLVNVALNKTISIKQGASVDGNKENLVDGNIYTYGGALETNVDVLNSWIQGNDGVGFVIDLGQTYSISEIKVYANPGNPSGRTQVWVDYSTDNATWTQVHARNNNISDAFSNATEDVLTINDFGTVLAQYVRVYSWTYTVWEEIEVYAVSDDTSGDNTGDSSDDNTGTTPGTTTDVDSVITLGEISDAIPEDLENIAVGKAIGYDVTGGTDCTFPKENLVDGDSLNICELMKMPDKSDTAYVVDLGDEYTISEIRLYAVGGRDSIDGRDSIWIDYSTDKTNWYNVCATATDNEAAGFKDLSQDKDVLIINNFGDPTVRYVRMKTASYAVMSELMVFVRHPIPVYQGVQYTTGVLTTEFSQDIAPASVTAESFKVYANDTLLVKDTDYTISFEDKKIKVEINDVKYHYDTKFKIELTNAIYSTAGEEYKIKTIPTIEKTAPPAIEITGFEIGEANADGKYSLKPTIKNNTQKDGEKAVVFVLLLDENNVVKYKKMKNYTINSNGVETPEFTIDTSGISGKCSIKAFLWYDLNTMKVRTESKKRDLNQNLEG